MAWSVGRWWLSVGTKNWHHYVSFGGMELLSIAIGHFHSLFMFNGGKPHWPRFYDRPRIFQHVLGPENKRWTDHAVGIQFWPVAVGVYWHATCYDCSAEYSKDLDAHYRKEN